MEVLSSYKIPVWWYSDYAVVFCKTHGAKFFTLIREFLEICLDCTFNFLMNPPFMVPIFLLFSILLTRDYFFRVVLTFLFFIIIFLDNFLLKNIRPFTIVAIIGIVTFIFYSKNQRFIYQGRSLYISLNSLFALLVHFSIESFIPSFCILIYILGILTWFMQKNWFSVFLTVFGLIFIINQGYWRDTMETLSILLWSCIFCMGIGIPFGIISAHRPRFYRCLRPILDLMQTIPSFVYLVPALFFFRIGMVPGLIATLIFVIPTPIRLIQRGISSTPKTLLEVAKSFGANRWQLLWKVELPHALPEIYTSLNQIIMLSLSMVVITATVGGNGLGVKVYRALQTGNVGLGFEAGCVIFVVAIVLDRLFHLRKET